MDSRRTTLTGSRLVDLALASAAVLALAYGGMRLRVYHQVTIVEVSIEQIAPDGRATPVPTPEPLQHLGNGHWPPESVAANAEAAVNGFVERWPRADAAPAGTVFAFTVRWAADSTDLDHRARLRVPADR